MRHRQIVIGDIVALIGINVDEVKLAVKATQNLDRVADVKCDATRYRRLRQMLANKVFEFVINLDGVDVRLVTQQAL